MAVLKNTDIDTLQNISTLLDKRYHTFNDEEIKLVKKYNSLIDKFINKRKELAVKSKKFNKEHKEYHRISVNMYANRKNGNTERAKYWEEELAKLKERGI